MPKSDIETVPPALAELLTGSCYCLAVRRASRRMIRLYDAALAEHGLTISQLALLAWVLYLRKPTVQKVAGLMEMDQSALSRGMVPLEREGLVTAAPDPDDKRKKVLSLTGEGQRRLVAGAEAWQRAQRQVEEEEARDGMDMASLMARVNALVATEKKAG
ncbi:MarR family winged helix-turn-helix transcriptional regulator [Pseudooceanicola sp. C21-150M6]|uniref:MarR family winged helix-turn-helix transcriptional regulator n=1 Tax=Pseudooceanicola sp. C21-150M6 TaxID=3434355 RepID=UPI003D7FFC48